MRLRLILVALLGKKSIDKIGMLIYSGEAVRPKVQGHGYFRGPWTRLNVWSFLKFE